MNTQNLTETPAAVVIDSTKDAAPARKTKPLTMGRKTAPALSPTGKKITAHLAAKDKVQKIAATKGTTAAKAAAKELKAKAAARGIKPKKISATRVDSGYTAAIRSLLLAGKHTISSMADEIHEQFPDKEVASIKRIGHNLAKRARLADPKSDIHWLPGQPSNTGYMARIDELLREGKLTTRQIGEKVSAEFTKDVVSAKKVIRARLKRLIKKGEKFHVPLESLLPKPAKEVKPKSPKAEKPAKAAKTTAKATTKAAKGKTAKPAPKAKKATQKAGK